ncbi:MAG: Rieske (2Fe-2S) protein, partial [Minwuiales bacterium]|nr:Rieske (2Fe-2S) protein [Minwuiales bacterium]
MTAGWNEAVPLDRLEAEGRAVVRLGGKQIALFVTPEGIKACNNRCPHEGYPLREGSLDDCILTCNWHNWKFDLTDGSNLLGGDRLRTYPVEVRDGQVWVEIVDPPEETRRAEIMDSLHDAFQDNDYARMARELARFARLSGDPLDTARQAVLWSFDRMEFGTTHAYAASADWLALYEAHNGDAETQLICLLESIGHMADDVLREQRYPFAEETAPYDEDSFVAAVERED